MSIKRLVVPCAAGVLLSLPYWRTEFGWLVIPVVVAYLAWLLYRQPGTKQIWLSGVVFFSVVVNWMYHIHATELIPNNILATLFLILTFSIVVGTLSVGFLFFGYMFQRLDKRWYIVSLPLLWAISEFLRSVLFSIVGYGPGGSLGAHWNFGSLAFPASVTPLGYAGRIVGQYGLSALVVLFSLSIMYLIQRRWRSGLIGVGIVSLFVIAGYLISPQATGSTLRMGVLQLDDTSYSDYGYQRDLTRLTASAGPRKPLDALILPEYSYIFENKEYRAAELKSTQELFGKNTKGLVITSRSGEGQEGRKNLVTFYHPDGEMATQQEKQFLIPGGEYIPYFYEWILVLSGNTSVIQSHQEQHSLTSAPRPAQPITYKAEKIGSLACSGAIAPDFYRRLASSGATVLTNSAALSTMGLSSGYYAQARQMAQFIAVANARPLIQSARGAEVFALDSNGQTTAESNKRGVHYIAADVTANSVKTPYLQIGDTVIVALMVIGLGILLFTKHKSIDKVS